MTEPLLLRNARIPAGPWHPGTAEPVWVALADGLLRSVGRPGEPEPAGAGRIVDLAGATLLPGFVDTHTHLQWSAEDRWTVNLAEIRSRAEVLRAVATVTGRVTPGDWVTGGDWLPDILPDTELPTTAELDRVSAAHPVLLISRDHSRALANTVALIRAKIGALTPDPVGGHIDRDETGSPTGVLRGEAVWGRLITGVVPPRNRARDRAEIADALPDLSARGITEIHDIGTLPETDTRPAFFRERSFSDITLLTEQGADLPVRYSFRASLLRAGELALPDLPPLVSFGGYKMSLDNGWYSAGGGGRPESFRWPGFDEALRLAKVADGDGQPVSIHAMGDLGVAEAAALLGALPSRRGTGLPPHRVIHARRIGRDTALLCADAGIVVETQPWEVVGSAERLTALGDAAFAQRLSPYRDLLDAGVQVAFGSDRRLGLRTDQADTDPLTGIQIAVTRSYPTLTGATVWQPEQAITLTEAVDCYTSAGAAAAGAARSRGRIAPGYAADLVALGQDPWAAPTDEIAGARPVLTICAGRISYQSTGLA